MFRFSLRWLLILVALVALGLFCLLYASNRLSDCLSVACGALLLAGIFGVIYRSQRRRAFWLGFCVFGWAITAYLHFYPDDTTVDRVTQSAHEAVAWSVPGSEEAARVHVGSGGQWENLGGGNRRLYFPRLYPFRSASRSLLRIAVALIGGLIAQWFHATRDRSDGL